MRHLKWTRPELIVLLALLAVAVLLHACQENLRQPTEPQFATGSGNRLLTITGGGTGSGTVTAPTAGGQPALSCTITAGVAALTGCSQSYPWRTVVTLTATPSTGHTFTGWSGACTRPGTCTVTMGVVRNVTASFAAPTPFSLTVTGGGAGAGVVTSQQGLSPAIHCTITAGQAAATGCGATYPYGTTVTLTAAPAVGHTFGGWGGDCSAAGPAPSCQLTITKVQWVSATFTPVGAPAAEAVFGKWGQAFSTPVVAIHMALLTDSHVLLWGGVGGQPWRWDPTTYPGNPQAGFTEMSTGSLMFCAGHTFLPDGRLLVTGGQDRVLGIPHGIKDVNIFDGTGWVPASPMNYARWYPTATTLANGNVVAMAGNDETTAKVLIPEIYDGSTWRALTGASLATAFYPRLFVEPKLGRLFHAGEAGTARYLDPGANGGTGGWTTLATRMATNRNYGSAVMLDGKVLYVGGGGATCPDLPNSSASLIDLIAASPAWRFVGAMASRRRQLNLTILADGKVLATGGTSACGADDPSGTVHAAELWDPATEQWSIMASARDRRNYHSTALLLPDGHVLVSGSNGILTAEVFTPPYLFNSDGTLAARPTYTLSSTRLGYNQLVTLRTSDAATIRKVTVTRLSAVTHAQNQSQQFNTLNFTAASDGQSLTLTTPGSGKVAPPGPYMLFILNTRGVPSVGQIVTLR
jgi:galactose oxidase-like protein/List-Bact-rpt repeat protein